MNISYMAVEAGKIILENGGETYRVEETINLICQAYNIKNADSYVTPTGIMFSA
ncbi:MAG: threonine/serine exporter family protein, partial [Clostridiaceae bacterium]